MAKIPGFDIVEGGAVAVSDITYFYRGGIKVSSIWEFSDADILTLR